MRPGNWSRAKLKLECLRRIARSGVVGLRKQILVNWIETYVQLSGEDAVEYQRLLDLKGNEEIRSMELTWLGKAEARGIKKGKAQGKAETVEQMRQLVLGRIEKRFGAVPESVQARVLAMNAVKPLAQMLEKLPLLRSAEDLLSRRRMPKNQA